ncbi:MAG TPA: hypothetical protein PLX35_14355 [Cyclobacteriaceae bacterium]|nr:hypothetical protein [Cyclobacteriaceae bacterium]
MKYIVTLVLLLAVETVVGQTYQSIIDEAFGHYEKQAYQLAVQGYRNAFKFRQDNAGDLYNAGCAAALAGDPKQAFIWLNQAISRGWANLDHLQSDTDLTSLHNSKAWDELVAIARREVDRIEANYDKPLQKELLQIFKEDQSVRFAYIEAQNKYGFKSRQVDSLARVVMHIDSVNLKKVKSILDQHGWVGPGVVGGQASQALFLVIQHSDLASQQKYLPMMRDAVQRGDAMGSALALLEDRVALGEGRKQTYGSQIGRDEKSGKYYVLPLEDPDHVDERREKVGLGKLADYVKHWGIVWNVEEYKKQTNK